MILIRQKLNKHQISLSEVDEMWMYMILNTIGECFENSSEVVGAVVYVTIVKLYED